MKNRSRNTCIIWVFVRFTIENTVNGRQIQLFDYRFYPSTGGLIRLDLKISGVDTGGFRDLHLFL